MKNLNVLLLAIALLGPSLLTSTATADYGSVDYSWDWYETLWDFSDYDWFYTS